MNPRRMKCRRNDLVWLWGISELNLVLMHKGSTGNIIIRPKGRVEAGAGLLLRCGYAGTRSLFWSEIRLDRWHSTANLELM